MSKFTRFQKIVIGLISTFVILGFVARGMQGNQSMSSLGYDVITMIRYALIEKPVLTIKNWTNDFANLWSVNEENDSLRYQLSQQPIYEAQLDESKRHVKELEEVLKMKNNISQFDSVVANVVARDVDSWDSVISIDLGSDDGMAVDMIVLSSKGVVGKVYSVGKYTSNVKLLTSEDRLNNVAVKVSISDSEASEGVLQNYDATEGEFIIHTFDDNDHIKEDMQVITSGKGGVYPSGLLIGSVNTIEELSNSVGKTIYVKPAADFQNFDTVIVIKAAKGE